MAIPAEHLYESCTCDSGMRGGKRCGDCGGRGILPKGATPTGAVLEDPVPESAAGDDPDGDDEDDDPEDGLDQLSLAELREKAKEAGVSAGGSRQAIVDRLRDVAGDDPDGDDEDDDPS